MQCFSPPLSQGYSYAHSLRLSHSHFDFVRTPYNYGKCFCGFFYDVQVSAENREHKIEKEALARRARRPTSATAAHCNQRRGSGFINNSNPSGGFRGGQQKFWRAAVGGRPDLPGSRGTFGQHWARSGTSAGSSGAAPAAPRDSVSHLPDVESPATSWRSIRARTAYGSALSVSGDDAQIQYLGVRESKILI